MSSSLRVALDTDELTLTPGQPVRLTVEVTNTSQVIDGLTASLVPTTPAWLSSTDFSAGGTFDLGPGAGDSGLSVRAEPALLPLFPDGTGTITLYVTASATYPAGSHTVNVHLTSSVRPEGPSTTPLTLLVTPVPAAVLSLSPVVRSGRHKARYQVIGDNQGNTPLDLDLSASDPERVAQARFHPSVLRLAPGESAAARLDLRARRHLLGGETSRRVNVVGTAPELEISTQATFRQQPVIPRGARTVVVLGIIVALWAAVFVIGLHKALGTDGLSKQVPPSFYAALDAAKSGTATAAGSSAGPLRLQSADATGPIPAGAVPKSGVVVGVGGTISGKVTASSTGNGIGRITVEAVRDSPSGPLLVSSAASGSDGSYTLVGLLPGQYKLLFTAQGYTQVWYPHATSEATAKPVTVNALGQTPGIGTVITGAPATITGTVATGQTPAAPVTVTVQGNQGSTTPIDTVTADAQGNYTITNLPAPGTYDLSFSSPGYQVGTDTEVVSGGAADVANTVTLSAGPGSIAGTVTDGTNPLGGVTISAAANGQTVTSATPTTGAVGQFTLGNLPTPATYLVTFTDSGYGTQTIAEHLGPGQNIPNMAVSMAGGAGQVSGLVSSATGGPLGGVTISVIGGSKPVTTQTLTAGNVGTYELSGLATPGNYTVTFSLAGYISQTVAVSLGSSGSAGGINATLPIGTGTITGAITSAAGAPLTGVSVSVTSGQGVRTTATSSSPPGGYTVSGLAPGSYTVTCTLSGYGTVTALVPVAAGQTATQAVVLTPAT